MTFFNVPNLVTMSRIILIPLLIGIYLVPTGQTLTPAGTNVAFDGRSVDMALSPDGKTLAVMMQDQVRLFDVILDANGNA